VLATAAGLNVSKLALYEPPYRTDPSHPALAADFVDRLTALIAEGRRGDAVELYQLEAVGIPRELVEQMREAPFRPALEAIAHTLVYDATIVGDLKLPTEQLRSISAPTIVICGENTVPFLRSAATAVAETIPGARLCVLPGQGHEIDPAATAPPLIKFLAG
jgi:pimeloyl-ACP methyl ester carboxylesterase